MKKVKEKEAVIGEFYWLNKSKSDGGFYLGKFEDEGVLSYDFCVMVGDSYCKWEDETTPFARFPENCFLDEE